MYSRRPELPAELTRRVPIPTSRLSGPSVGFAALRLGDSQAIKVGQLVIAIVNLLDSRDGHGGVVSALGRSPAIPIGPLDGRHIQTDAALNPGIQADHSSTRAGVICVNTP